MPVVTRVLTKVLAPETARLVVPVLVTREDAPLISRLPTDRLALSSASVEFESVNTESGLPKLPTPTSVNVPPEAVVAPAYVLNPDNFTVPA